MEARPKLSFNIFIETTDFLYLYVLQTGLIWRPTYTELKKEDQN